MSERAFKRYLLILAALVGLSATTFPGGLLGFFFGVGIAFFVAGPALLMEAFLKEAGLSIPDHTIPYVLIGLYGLFALIVVAKAWRGWRRGTADQARLDAFRAAVVTVLPLMGWLSSKALVRAWPH